MAILLEIIAFDIDSCKMIEQAGGNRIELCANPLEGGTTVSYGMMKAARTAVNIPVFPIIRPRGGDFLYSDAEYRVMQEDIQLAKETGMDGVVIGILLANGQIDKDRVARLVELAYPMEVTFHRAFDHAADPLRALEDIIDCGCQRILTSGGSNTAIEGQELIKACVQAADARIIILPGAGIRSGNIRALAEATGLKEFHSSARRQMASGMRYHNQNIQESSDSISVDIKEIERCRTALDGL